VSGEPTWNPTVKQTPYDKYTPSQIITALELSAGIYLAAGKRLGCSHSTVALYVKKYPPIKEALDNILHERVDWLTSLVLAPWSARASDGIAPSRAPLPVLRVARLAGFFRPVMDFL
jgi:hypothetical protein